MAEASTARRTLVLASGNAGKLRELAAMLEPLGWRVRPQGDWRIGEAVEDGLSFIENALIKARHAASCTGLPALGDDSGLVVDALGGEPGIFSSRYAGEAADDGANNRKLLQALAGIQEEARGAHFYCAMALMRHADDPAPLLATGRWRGRILDAATGAGGFGYDPLFWVPEQRCSSAQLPASLKNRLSHRGQALAALLGQIESAFASGG
jgi:XTP/dITP diphosphohydrolase